MKNIPEPYSPTAIDERIDLLLDKMNPDFDPEQVPIQVEPYSKVSNCYVNVEQKVKRDGGSVHYGWVIIVSDILCEAERHAVWESDEGELIDITPRPQNWKTVMFVSDNDFVYNGELVDNIRVNTTFFYSGR